MKKRSGIKIICRLILLGTVVFLLGGSATAATPANQDSETKERSMDTVNKTESAVIPPIDAAAPHNFQTASFGLG